MLWLNRFSNVSRERNVLIRYYRLNWHTFLSKPNLRIQYDFFCPLSPKTPSQCFPPEVLVRQRAPKNSVIFYSKQWKIQK